MAREKMGRSERNWGTNKKGKDGFVRCLRPGSLSRGGKDGSVRSDVFFRKKKGEEKHYS